MKSQIPVYDPETKTMKFPTSVVTPKRSRTLTDDISYLENREFAPLRRTKLTDKIKIQALQSQSLQTYQYARNVKQFADAVNIDGIESQLVFLKQGIEFLERLIQEVKNIEGEPLKNE